MDGAYPRLYRLGLIEAAEEFCEIVREELCIRGFIASASLKRRATKLMMIVVSRIRGFIASASLKLRSLRLLTHTYSRIRGFIASASLKRGFVP